jgi:hypothetical protein
LRANQEQLNVLRKKRRIQMSIACNYVAAVSGW